jgi:1,4-dihydroxy-2-naphthoyl-CoA hydrolase
VPEPPVSLLPPEKTLDGVLGIEVTDADPKVAHGRMPVSDANRQPYGIVHGGAYAALAETVVSLTTAMAVYNDGMIAVGQSNHTSFLRPISEGTVHAEARCRHRGRTSWVWEVDCTDDEGRLCAVVRVTMAVRPPPGGSAGS